MEEIQMLVKWQDCAVAWVSWVMVSESAVEKLGHLVLRMMWMPSLKVTAEMGVLREILEESEKDKIMHK